MRITDNQNLNISIFEFMVAVGHEVFLGVRGPLNANICHPLLPHHTAGTHAHKARSKDKHLNPMTESPKPKTSAGRLWVRRISVGLTDCTAAEGPSCPKAEAKNRPTTVLHPWRPKTGLPLHPRSGSEVPRCRP